MYGLVRRKLTDKDRLKIIRLYSQDLVRIVDISRRFGVSEEVTRKILRDANVPKVNRRLDVK